MPSRNRSRVRTRIALENLERRYAMAADFSLLVDSNDSPAAFPENPLWASAVGDDVVFSGDVGSAELWEIDRGETGTAHQISDFGALYGGVTRAKLPLSIGARTIFQAGDLAHGTELWSTDGTSAGTFRLGDFLNGPGSSDPGPPVRVGNTAYFFANSADGRGLWQTDGTIAGTKPILARYDSHNLNFEEALGEFQGQIYFIARDLSNTERSLATVDPVSGKVELMAQMPAGQVSEILAVGDRLLITNGAEQDKPDELLSYRPQDGTVNVVASWNEGLSRPEVLNGRAVFSVSNQLWTTDGTSDGTQVLVDHGIYEYRPRAQGMVIAAIDNRMLLVVNGNYTIKDLVSGALTDTGVKYPGHPYNTSIAVAGDQFVFLGVAGDGSFNLYAMQRDAVVPDVVQPVLYPLALSVQREASGAGVTYPSVANGRVFVPLQVGGNVLLHEYLPDTRQFVAVAPLHGTLGSEVTLLEHSDSATWFSTKSGYNAGVKLWQTDGSPSGTREITFPAEAGTPWQLQMPQVIDGRLVLEVTSAEKSSENVLWVIDPSTGLPQRLSTVQGRSVSKIFELNGERFQLRSPEFRQLGLYRINSDLSVGDVVAMLPALSNSHAEIELTQFGQRVLFIVNSQFWQSDGTAEGTFALITGAKSDDAFQQPLVVGDKAWLITRSREFYLAPKTGSQAEYVGKLPDQLAPWTQRFQDSQFYPLGDKLAFIGTLTRGDVSSWVDDGNLWITDGTSAGTQLLRDFGRGKEDVSPHILGVVNGKVIAVSGNAYHGFSLWASHGTPEGTAVILHSNVGEVVPDFPQTFDLLPDGRAIVQSFYPGRGREIVITDGTPAGTDLFADIAPGSMSSFARFVVAGQHIVAAAQTLEYGRWETFGFDYGSYVRRIPAEMQFYVDEEAPGGLLGNVAADGVMIGDDTAFRLRDEAAAAKFILDAATGELRLRPGESLDFETEPEVSLTAEIDYRDSLTGQMATRTVPVRVRVLNQFEPPKLEPQTFVVEENVPAGLYIGTLVAQHDSAANVLFSRTGGWPVRVDPSGRVNVLDPTLFDYEKFHQLGFTVRVTDPITGFWDEGPVTLQIQNVDEPPRLSVRPEPIDVFSGTIKEVSLPANTLIDPEGEVLSYSLALANGDALPEWIVFDAASRQLRMSPGAEHVGLFPLRLTATDPGGHSASVAFNLTVLNGQFPWHNPIRPNDVNRDGSVTALDALLVINQLNVVADQQLSSDNSGLEHFYDSSADGWVTALDALLIINAINSGEAEAESGGEVATLTPVDDGAWQAAQHDEALLASLAALENERLRRSADSLALD